MPALLKPLKWYRNLGTKKGRLEAGGFPVEGARAIAQIIESNPAAIMEILSVTGPPPEYREYDVRVVTESQFRYISHTQTPQGVMAVVMMPEDIYSDTLPSNSGDRILLLEDIQDPGNTGTLIRTAAAFDFSGVLMTENCADPLTPKCIQSTAGSVLSVWLRRTPECLELAGRLRQSGYSLVAADLHGTSGLEVSNDKSNIIMALGNEGAGLSERLLDMADYRVKIPTHHRKAESLNVAASGAILMYLASRDTI